MRDGSDSSNVFRVVCPGALDKEDIGTSRHKDGRWQ